MTKNIEAAELRTQLAECQRVISAQADTIAQGRQLQGACVAHNEMLLAQLKKQREEMEAIGAGGVSGQPITTPAATWRLKGEPDPHGTHYDCERAALTLGKYTDDELANAAFMNYDRRPPLQDIIDGKAHSPIAYMTAVKDRIRWLSRALIAATSQRPASAKPGKQE